MLMVQMYGNSEFMRLFRLNDCPDSEVCLRQQIQTRLQTPMENLYYLDGILIHRIHGPIGIAALANYNAKHRRAEFLIGIFSQTRRGRGHAIEASLMLLDLGFNRYNLNRIYAYTYSYNTLAQKSLSSAGFEFEGVQSQHCFDTNHQIFVDLCSHGLIAERFRRSRRLRRLSQRLLGRDITLTPAAHEPARAGGDRTPLPASRQFRRSGPLR